MRERSGRKKKLNNVATRSRMKRKTSYKLKRMQCNHRGNSFLHSQTVLDAPLAAAAIGDTWNWINLINTSWRWWGCSASRRCRCLLRHFSVSSWSFSASLYAHFCAIITLHWRFKSRVEREKLIVAWVNWMSNAKALIDERDGSVMRIFIFVFLVWNYSSLLYIIFLFFIISDCN